MLRGPSQEAFQQYVPELVARMKQIKSIADVTSDLNNNGLSVNVEVNRQLAARYGITPATIDNALYDALGQRIVSTIFNQSNQYRVVLVAKPETLPNLQALGDLYLPTQTGSTGQVPLRGIADIKVTKSPLVISHLAQFPAVTVSFNLAPDASLSTAVDEIGRAEQAIHLPPSITTSFQGAAQAFQDSLSSEVFLLAAALVTVYLVLGVLYESYIHPVTILSTLPSAGLGALLALMIAGSDLDVIGIIGIVLLIGIVKKNGIMIVDFALEAERKHGKSPEDAIFEASMLRFRPILMTTLAAMLGALPLLVGNGTGSELRRPLGLAIIGGLLVSQVLTLFTTPVIYLMFDRISQRFGRKASEPSGGAGRVNIPAIFINRPVATSLLAIAIALSGLLAYFQMPVAPLPNVTMPVIAVQANMAGASPEIMASTVAEPLERRLATIAGVNELTSQSSVGSAQVVIQFAINRDINGAARDVEAAIQAARADLPTTLRGNPSYRKFNPADSPIIILGLTSKTLTTAQLYDSADTVIQQQLSQISGVGQIQLGGGALPSVRVEIQPDKLSSYGIGLEDVRAAISSANADSAKGYIDQGEQRYEVMSNDQATKAADYQNLVIAYRNGAPVLLHDVAAVVDSNENIRNAGLYNNLPTVGVIVYPLPGANIIKTVAQIKKVLPSVVATLPPNIEVHIAMDRSQSVTAAVGDTERSLMIAVVLVIGVVFVFLQSPRATLIPAVVLPISILGHVRPDVPLGLQHRQSLLDVAHHRHGLRGRRCGGGARKRRAPRRIGDGRARSGARGQRRGEFHGRIHEPFADRRIHPDSAVPRRHRAPVPRIRRDALDRDLDLAAGLAHGHSHDVRLSAEARRVAAFEGALGGVDREAIRAVQERLLALAHPSARSCAARGHRSRGDDLAHPRADARVVHHAVPGAGQRTSHGPDHRRPEHLLSGDAEEAAAASADRADRSRRGLGHRIHRHARPQHRHRLRGLKPLASASSRPIKWSRGCGRS